MFLFQVSVAQLISLTSGEAISNAISYGEDDLLGLESADAVVSLPGAKGTLSISLLCNFKINHRRAGRLGYQ